MGQPRLTVRRANSYIQLVIVGLAVYADEYRGSLPTRAFKSLNNGLKYHVLLPYTNALLPGSGWCGAASKFPCVVAMNGKYSLMCVSSDLVCDGHVNCPMTGSDEDPQVCGLGLDSAPQQTLPARTTPATLPGDTDYDIESSGSEDTLPEALSRYGPWGYLMLGTLICGALLMLCGLWECCCRRRKQPREVPGASAPPLPSHPHSIFIIGSQQRGSEAAPPKYEELDQPPDYGILFPGEKEKAPGGGDAGKSGPSVQPC
uniref:Uncharacterized protein n=1 Tax=Timema tahoe TaxID=61484 RepID=A0A7R9NWW5_9NEOP|nr:unnamed protein product [Timema tahoe]